MSSGGGFLLTEEEKTLQRFKTENPKFFEKDEQALKRHLATVITFLVISTSVAVFSSSILVKILTGVVSAFFWFCLINVTIHHHLTHKNSAESDTMKKFLDKLYLVAVFNGPKRMNRYTRAHLNHHARPFHETDVDHHYGVKRFLAMEEKRSWKETLLYYLELTFVGAHVPGWQDDSYMNSVPLEKWTAEDYEKVKEKERQEARKVAVLQWGGFFIAAWLVPPVAWGWAFPMLLVKNWSHFLGQFQHYEGRLLDPSTSIYKKTKTFRVPSFLNYLTGGEISGHFLHHLFPEMPYYHVEEARKKFVAAPEFAAQFAIY